MGEGSNPCSKIFVANFVYFRALLGAIIRNINVKKNRGFGTGWRPLLMQVCVCVGGRFEAKFEDIFFLKRSGPARLLVPAHVHTPKE